MYKRPRRPDYATAEAAPIYGLGASGREWTPERQMHGAVAGRLNCAHHVQYNLGFNYTFNSDLLLSALSIAQKG